MTPFASNDPESSIESLIDIHGIETLIEALRSNCMRRSGRLTRKDPKTAGLWERRALVIGGTLPAMANNADQEAGIRITSADSFGGFITLTPTYVVAINGTDFEVKCSYVDHVEVFPYGGDDESVEYRRSLAPVRIEWCDIEHIHVY